MTVVNVQRARPLGAHKAGGLGDIENTLLLLPIPVGFAVAILSLLAGCTIGYAALQIILFTLICPLLYIIKYDDRYTGSVLLISFLKLFYISQIVCIFIFRAPDAGLMRPLITATALAVGLSAGMAGIGAAALLSSVTPPYKPILRLSMAPSTIRRLGYPTAVVGLISQAVWTAFTGTLTADQHGGLGGTISGLVVFSALSPLAILSICCFAAARLIESGGKKIMSRELIAVTGMYIALIMPLATKTEPLKPFVALTILALVYKWRPSPGLVAAGLAALLFVAEFLYPTITLSRLRAFGEERPLPVVFAETAIEAISNPAELAYAKDFTKNYDRRVGQSYFGRPMGFVDRFTPRVTDRLITASQYTVPTGFSEFKEAAISLLPQTLGFKRNTTADQAHIEQALFRHYSTRGKVDWENTGYVGSGYLSGGLPVAAAIMFTFGLIASLAARMTFGPRGSNIVWIPYLVTFMLVPDGMTLPVSAPYYFWTWILLTAGLMVTAKVASERLRPT